MYSSGGVSKERRPAGTVEGEGRAILGRGHSYTVGARSLGEPQAAQSGWHGNSGDLWKQRRLFSLMLPDLILKLRGSPLKLHFRLAF